MQPCELDRQLADELRQGSVLRVINAVRDITTSCHTREHPASHHPAAAPRTTPNGCTSALLSALACRDQVRQLMYLSILQASCRFRSAAQNTPPGPAAVLLVDRAEHAIICILARLSCKRQFIIQQACGVFLTVLSFADRLSCSLQIVLHVLVNSIYPRSNTTHSLHESEIPFKNELQAPLGMLDVRRHAGNAKFQGDSCVG